MKTHLTSIRLSLTGWQLLKKMAESQGVTQTAVIEMALRYYAKRLQVTLKDTSDER